MVPDWPHLMMASPAHLPSSAHQAAQLRGGVGPWEPGLRGKGLGSDLGSELAVQPQTKPFTSLGLSFSTCEMSTPHRGLTKGALMQPAAQKRLWKHKLLGL